MTQHTKEFLSTLSNKQLIHLIDKMQHSLFLIGETCVDVSKGHIDPDNAIQDIRNYIYHFPSMSNAENFTAVIDLDMGKITKEEYRKIMIGE